METVTVLALIYHFLISFIWRGIYFSLERIWSMQFVSKSAIFVLSATSCRSGLTFREKERKKTSVYILYNDNDRWKVSLQISHSIKYNFRLLKKLVIFVKSLIKWKCLANCCGMKGIKHFIKHFHCCFWKAIHSRMLIIITCNQTSSHPRWHPHLSLLTHSRFDHYLFVTQPLTIPTIGSATQKEEQQWWSL